MAEAETKIEGSDLSEEEIEEIRRKDKGENRKDLAGHARNMMDTVKHTYDRAKTDGTQEGIKLRERYDRFQSERREQEFANLERREAETKERYVLAKRKDDLHTLEKEESRLRNKPMKEILSGIGGVLRGIGHRERREERPRYYRREPRYRARPRYREPSREMRREDRFGGAQSGAAQLLSGTGSSMLSEERQPRRFERREAPSGIAAMLHGTGSGASSFLGGNRSGSGFPEFGVNLKKKRF